MREDEPGLKPSPRLTDETGLTKCSEGADERSDYERGGENGLGVVKSLNVLGGQIGSRTLKAPRMCVCVHVTNDPRRASPLPYRSATHPWIMCVRFCISLGIYVYRLYLWVCVCVY